VLRCELAHVNAAPPSINPPLHLHPTRPPNPQPYFVHTSSTPCPCSACLCQPRTFDKTAAAPLALGGMHPYVVITLTVLWYIAYPFWKLLQWFYYLLKPLRYLLYILSVPFIHIVHFLGKALRWPIDFVAKLEVRNWIERSTSALEEHWFVGLSDFG
jgi:hypothetical protein